MVNRALVEPSEELLHKNGLVGGLTYEAAQEHGLENPARNVIAFKTYLGLVDSPTSSALLRAETARYDSSYLPLHFFGRSYHSQDSLQASTSSSGIGRKRSSLDSTWQMMSQRANRNNVLYG